MHQNMPNPRLAGLPGDAFYFRVRTSANTEKECCECYLTIPRKWLYEYALEPERIPFSAEQREYYTCWRCYVKRDLAYMHSPATQIPHGTLNARLAGLIKRYADTECGLLEDLDAFNEEVLNGENDDD
jgi:hypothetical protein